MMLLTQFVYLIETSSTGLYLLLVLVLLANLRTLMRSRADLHNAEFALERELSLRRRAGAVTRALFAVEALLAVYAITNVIAPTLRADALGLTGTAPGTDTVVQFQTLEPAQQTLVNAQGTPISREQVNAPFETLTALPRSGDVGVIATATPAPTPPGTIIPAPPVVGCDARPQDPAQAILQIPANGQVLFESVTVRGIATAANFARYKFEISGPSTGNSFAPFGGDRTQPVKDMGTLGQLVLIPFEPGQYLFKLAVFDVSDQLKASCTVTVYLRRFQPTPTVATIVPTP
jgi:hypothetical protein